KRMARGRAQIDSTSADRRQKESKSPRIALARWTSGSKQIDDALDGCVGAVIGGFQPAGRLMAGGGAVVEAAVGEWAAEPFVEEEEEQGDLDAFWGETISVSGSVTLQ